LDPIEPEPEPDYNLGSYTEKLSKKLAPRGLEIPEKTDTANKPQPSEEVQLKAINLRTSDNIKTTMIARRARPQIRRRTRQLPSG
jgi:hypothetical protein